MVDGGNYGGGGPDEPTAEECVQNGMYWYGRSDLEAARAWWDRALDIEPNNLRARECLELLAQEAQDRSASLDLPSLDLPSADLTDGPVAECAQASDGPNEGGTPDVLPPLFADPSTGGLSLDLPALEGDEGEPGQPEPTPQPAATSAWDVAGAADPDSPTGWDQMPAGTQPLTIPDDDRFDAVPEVSSLVTEPSLDDIAALASGAAPSSKPEGRAESGARSPPQRVPSDLIGAIRDRYRFHDFDGVVDLAEKYPVDAPEADEVRRMLAQAKANLLKMYESKLGPFDRTPRVLITSEEVIWLSLNHRAGFILSQIDGTVTYEDLIALSGMPRLDTVRILAELLEQKVIGTD